MEVVVAFLLVVADTSLERRIAFMGVEHPAQLVDIGLAHALGGQAAGHAFERFADFVQLDQLGVVERHHPRPDMRHAHQQALAFEPVDGFAQRPAADAVGTRQLRLGDLAARGDLALDDGRLDSPKDVFGQGFRFVCQRGTGSRKVQHIVDTLIITWPEIS
ncbi:hypothetical protein D3C76_1327500 [compost metagenome]